MNLGDAHCCPANRPALFPQLRVIDGKVAYIEAPTPPSEVTEKARLHLCRVYRQARAINRARRAGGTINGFEAASLELSPREFKEAKARKVKPKREFKAGRKAWRLTRADAAAIRDRKAAGGITNQALATEYGVSRSTIQAILSGRNHGEHK